VQCELQYFVTYMNTDFKSACACGMLNSTHSHSCMVVAVSPDWRCMHSCIQAQVNSRISPPSHKSSVYSPIHTACCMQCKQRRTHTWTYGNVAQ